MKKIMAVVFLVVLAGCNVVQVKPEYGNGKYLQVRNSIDNSLEVQLSYPNERTCRIAFATMVEKSLVLREMADLMICSEADKSDLLRYAATLKSSSIPTLYVHTRVEYDCTVFVENIVASGKGSVDIVSPCGRNAGYR